MSVPGKTLYLLDAMALAYRAHFIFINRPLINSKGQNTSATYGFTTALLKLIEEHRIEFMAVVFDVHTEGGTFREEMYEEYKAHRDPPPEDLLANLPRIKEVVRAMDIPVVEVEGVEADDVIGTLARSAESDAANVVIVSPDKDFQQLLSDRVSLLRPAYRGEAFDPVTPDTFRQKYGLEPIQFIDILALMGDAADNVPGVRGIGEKTAVKLLLEYGSVENVLDHAGEISGKKAREGLLQHADDALLSKRLVTILTDVPNQLDWHDFHRKTPDLGRLKELFLKYEFSTLYRRVATLGGASAPSPSKSQTDLFADHEDQEGDASNTAAVDGGYDSTAVSYHLITNLDELSRVVDRLEGVSPFVFDTETTSTDPMMASLVGVSFAIEPGEAWYVPTPLPDGATTGSILKTLQPLFTEPTLKIGQNIKYDLLVLSRHGLGVAGNVRDTMIAHYLIAPDSAHGMDALAVQYLAYRPIPISELIGKGKNQLSMREVPLEKVAPYACEDADVTLRLWQRFEPELTDSTLHHIAFEIEFPLVRVLADMEESGVLIDAAILDRLAVTINTDLERLQAEIFASAGETFNINSPQQLGVILFDKLGLPVVSKTSTGRPSTREDVLKELATEHSLPAQILDWRELAKLKSTYVDALGALIHPETGRVHTSFSQTTAATGRLASSNPNLQNIPIRTRRGREIRSAFVASPGNVLLSADYAQIELRILASLSEDEPLSRAFESGEDIHARTASLIFRVPPEELSREQRNRAKEVNYGIPYGISAFGLAQRLRCSRSEAAELIDGYRRSYPGVSRYLALQVETAREKGYVETILGRRRYVPDIHARNRNVRAAAERVAVNMPIQGTQADMIKIAMLRIHERIRSENLQSKMLLQVHDELLFEVPENETDRMEELVRHEMIHALPLRVPIEVGIGVGKNWLEAH